MGQFRDASIKSIVEELNQSFFLPDIQREYVWLRNAKEKKIEQLFDSILRGYPIGSFLFWTLKKNDIETNKNAKEESDKLNFQLYKFIENYDERSPHNEKVNIEQVNADNLSIVLDGQQRLTSLYIGLKGSRTLKRPRARWDNPNAFQEKFLYLNLRHKPDDNNPDSNYNFEFFTKNSVPKPDGKNYWFKVGDILAIDSILSYSRTNDLSDDEGEILEKLKDAFCSKSLISFFEESEKNLDKVLKIFIRVNSGGTQLSYSDLLMSILTANFSSDIRYLMNKFIDSLRDQDFAIMGRDQVLKTCLFLTDCSHTFQLKNFSKSNINKIEQSWELINTAIFEAVSLLAEFGFRNRLSSAYILSVVAYYFYKNGAPVDENDKSEILSFVRKAQITSYFTTSLDGKLDAASKALKAATNFEQVNKNFKSSRTYPINITSDDIDRIIYLTYGNPAVLPVLQLLYPTLDYKNSTFHIDHIYPKSKFRRSNPELNSEYLDNANYLFNLQLLQGEENISKKAKDPEIWLTDYYNSDVEKIKAYKIRNYIDADFDLVWSKIEDFDISRSEKIKNKLKELLLSHA